MRNSRREGDTISTYAITDIKSFVCWLRSGYRSSMTGKVFSSVVGSCVSSQRKCKLIVETVPLGLSMIESTDQ